MPSKPSPWGKSASAGMLARCAPAGEKVSQLKEALLAAMFPLSSEVAESHCGVRRPGDGTSKENDSPSELGTIPWQSALAPPPLPEPPPSEPPPPPASGLPPPDPEP